MPNPVQSALRAAMERGVELVAAYNRKRLPKTGNDFLIGVHEPMRSELTLGGLAVTGSIPAGLNGRYLKMGANPVNPDPVGHHWFLGDGMVHGIESMQSCGGGVIRLQLLLVADRRWRVESPGDGGGKRPRACRSARRCARRGRAAPWSCSSASAELWPCAKR